jgi:hypothetical protein
MRRSTSRGTTTMCSSLSPQVLNYGERGGGFTALFHPPLSSAFLRHRKWGGVQPMMTMRRGGYALLQRFNDGGGVKPIHRPCSFR